MAAAGSGMVWRSATWRLEAAATGRRIKQDIDILYGAVKIGHETDTKVLIHRLAIGDGRCEARGGVLFEVRSE